MSDAGAQPRSSEPFSRFVEMPRLELPKFQLRTPTLTAPPSTERTVPTAHQPVAQPVAPSPEPAAVTPFVVESTPAHHDPVPWPAPEAMPPVAPGSAEFAPLPYAPQSVATMHSTSPAPSAVDPTTLERLKSDAMLGLVVGIGVAVIAVATVVMLWSKFHGVAPGTF